MQSSTTTISKQCIFDTTYADLGLLYEEALSLRRRVSKIERTQVVDQLSDETARDQIALAKALRESVMAADDLVETLQRARLSAPAPQGAKP